MREPVVFVVDDDELARQSVCDLVQSMGIQAKSFCSAEEFLESYTADQPGKATLPISPVAWLPMFGCSASAGSNSKSGCRSWIFRCRWSS